jgi:hypothetical protein
MSTYQFMKIRQHCTCLLIFPVLSYLKLVLLHLEMFSGKTLSFKLILRNVCLYKQPNVTMTPKHIMQTRSTQSILKRVFGFNCFKFSLIILKPVNY